MHHLVVGAESDGGETLGIFAAVTDPSASPAHLRVLNQSDRESLAQVARFLDQVANGYQALLCYAGYVYGINSSSCS